MTLLPDLPQNAALLALLREQGVAQEGGAYAYDGWELRTHPDLVERLEDLAPGWPVLWAFGVPVLAAKGVAAVVARGTGLLLVRLSERPAEPLKPGQPCPPLTGQGEGWYPLCPWQSELTSSESQRLLSLQIRHALTYAASLSDDDSTDWQGRPVQAAGGRTGKAKGRRPSRNQDKRRGGRGRHR
ncbi:hypothetical protein [Streptomyces sp. SID4982]|uniref:hypothetical protein n=1 Tax=Streptomyces sp. SID4982 TaxID=2690291 RepID=UPI001370D7D5|nr:hypothetical protein [Streptomyces sp. SID4982]MYS13448.1 hypothetical protein [Streptomyces sp. SID4982]